MAEGGSVELINGLRAQYVPGDWTGTYTGGVKPLGVTVILLCDKAAGASAGGIVFTDDMVERFDAAAEQGVIAAISEDAFLLGEDGRAWRGYKPVPGDHVYFEKYAGKLALGKDGKTYRILDYRQIGAVYEKD